MASFFGIISGSELIGLGEGSSARDLIDIFGQPDETDAFFASNEKVYYYRDLNVIMDPDEKSIVTFELYSRGVGGYFALPDNITEADIIKKESDLDEVASIFDRYSIKYVIIDRVGDKFMEFDNGEIVFVDYGHGIYTIYCIHLKRI